MATEIKYGERIYIPFINGKSVQDSQKRPRMYKSIEQLKKKYPGFKLRAPGVVEYAPVVHGEWYFAEDSVFRCSVCGRICHEIDAPYCYCGAKMKTE